MAGTASALSGRTQTSNSHASTFLAILTTLLSLPTQLLVAARQWLVELANDYAEHEFGARPLANPDAYMGIMREVQVIGGAVIMIAIVVIVVNEVLTVDAVNDSEGPFSGVIDSLETTGVAAMTLLVVGLLVVAAVALMRYFGNWG